MDDGGDGVDDGGDSEDGRRRDGGRRRWKGSVKVVASQTDA